MYPCPFTNDDPLTENANLYLLLIGNFVPEMGTSQGEIVVSSHYPVIIISQELVGTWVPILYEAQGAST